MRAKGTQHPSPLILQLVKNREEQRAADAQKHDLEFFTTQPIEGVDFGPVMEWVRVFFQFFGFPCFPVVFYSSGYLP